MSWRTVNYALNKVILLINSLPPSCGRLHHKCLTLTNTGRMIMSEPNIQSIPKQFSITKGSKSEADSEQSFCLRNIFVAGNGKLLISADYSQIELRILAHLSGDETLIAAFNSSGVDIFKSIAAMFYSEISSIDDVTDKQRDTTKQTCYGILYGMGAQTLAQQMNTSETDAQNAMDSFMNSYPMVKVYFNRLVAQCKEKGYIETISGRRRYLPEIKSVRLKMRSHAERQAVNSTIQGSAADIVKMATYKIHCAVASLGWNTLHQNTRSNTTDFFLVHHIHDELIYEVDEKKLHEAVSVIERCMVDAFPMSVKLAVRIKVGKLWGDLNKYENFIPVL
nr:uncharacterized protein LOC101242017 isoform X1 [Ciona intestinalis]|eukprot:XP_004225500.1 uncharacterized protein LOC101242017 isoform X1 [Ciona intestinalis]